MPDSTPIRPVVLVIRDGWGENPHRDHDPYNAIRLATTPVADRLAQQWPTTLIRTCGVDVGLPAGTMGNSEVGHQNIGAGRVVDQELMRISRSVDDGSFFENAAFHEAFEHASSRGGRVHLLGLVSDGYVHSDIEHLFALIELARRRGCPADGLLIHAITDGRDTAPTGGRRYLAAVEAKVAEAGVGRIASVIGRYFAMDRDHRWDRVKLAYDALTRPIQANAATALDAVEDYYANPVESGQSGDEFVTPTRIGDTPRIAAGDAVIFFNFRGDRPREMTRAFVLDDAALAAQPHGGFDRGGRLDDLCFVTMTGYESGLPVTAIAFDKPPKLPDILGQVVVGAGLTQFRCAETEKYAHVTYFFNDYREAPLPGEHRLLVPSPTDVTTYDQKPEMSAAIVCGGVLDRLAADDCEPLIVVNFANADMVGHTGKLDAVISAVETTDACVGEIVDATLARGGALVVTADHGNAEQMWDPEHDCPHTAHTTYDVPLFVVGEAFRGVVLREGGRLADIAPTVLAMMGLPVPTAMTGQSFVSSSLCSQA